MTGALLAARSHLIVCDIDRLKVLVHDTHYLPVDPHHPDRHQLLLKSQNHQEHHEGKCFNPICKHNICLLNWVNLKLKSFKSFHILPFYHLLCFPLNSDWCTVHCTLQCLCTGVLSSLYTVYSRHAGLVRLVHVITRQRRGQPITVEKSAFWPIGENSQLNQKRLIKNEEIFHL